MSQRLHYLDALRSFAILYGILVHAATIGVPASLDWITEVSGFFRMGTFFLVSGFFAAMTLERGGARQFLRRRLPTLIVPFLAGLILLNPITNYLIHCWHNGYMPILAYFQTAADQRLLGDLPGPAVWHLHLWFLIALAVYVLLAPAARHAAQGTGRWQDRLAALPGWGVVLLTGVAVGMVSLSLRIGYELLLGAHLEGTRAIWITRITLHYMPYFMLGIVLFGHPPLFERFQRISLTALLCGFAAIMATRSLPDGDLREAAGLLSGGMVTIACAAALLFVFRRLFSRETPLSRAASSVYSIYIMHFLMIYLAAFAWRAAGLDGYALYAAVAATTGLCVFAVHRFLIAPSPLLSFLFNGKPLRARLFQPASPNSLTIRK